MQATTILKDEHDVIERVLASLEAAVLRIESGHAVRAGFFLQAADFIQGFADGCHHRKEEGLLFPAMEAAGIPRQGGPVGVMLAEHEEGRRLTANLRQAAQALASGDITAQAALVESARDYASLLRQHIMKENNILFRMAEMAIQGEAQSRLFEAFERAEHEETGAGTHEQYVAIADALEREAARWESGPSH